MEGFKAIIYLKAESMVNNLWCVAILIRDHRLEHLYYVDKSIKNTNMATTISFFVSCILIQVFNLP